MAGLIFFWRDTGGVTPPPVTIERGDGARRNYEKRKRRYYRQLQEELDRQLAASEPQAVQPRAKRRKAAAEPQPVSALPMIAGEATRIVRDLIAEARARDEMQRNALMASLMLYAEHLAKEQLAQQDEEDALAVLLTVM